jgi:hypothetical protein
METLPPEIKMYIKQFIGHPTALLIKKYQPRQYLKQDWDIYDEWLHDWREYKKTMYEVEYWAAKYAELLCVNR